MAEGRRRTIRLGGEWDQLVEMARARGTTASAVIRGLIRDQMRAWGKETK